MKKIRYISRLAGIMVVVLAVNACEPQMADKPEIGAAPTADQLNFTITPGSDAFNFVIENTSSVTGIASWDFGNGTKATGNSNIARYPMPGDYTIAMTLVTRGGMATITKTLTQTETDFSIFTDPVYVNLTGGIDNTAGKTWVLDVATRGHLGVGPVDDPTAMSWWAAAPYDKDGTGLMDDEITFKLDGFVVTYDNKGVSYVKAYRANDPALASVYLNPRENKGDWDVDYATPVSGTFNIIKVSEGKYTITLNGEKPIFPCFDVGAKDNTYTIRTIEENLLELTCLESYEGWNNWHYYLIPKGYVRPTITYTVNATEGVDNEVSCSVTGYTIPEGQKVYNVTAKLNTSLGVLTGTKQIVLANNNSAYVPFLLDMMIVYNDLSEVQVFPLLADNCTLDIVDNPDKEYPNKSAKVAHFSRTGNQYANAYIRLPAGFRFDLRQQHVFKVMVRGKAGDVILLKLENSDPAEPWKTGTEITYTISKDNTWEVAVYDFNGVPGGFTWTGDMYAPDVVADDRFNHDYYNTLRIMCNPTVADGTHSFWLDELSGPHVEGIHK